MRICLNKNAVERQTVLTLLRGLCQLIPSLTGVWNSWQESEFEPAAAGLKLGQILVEQFRRLQQQLAEQQYQLEALSQYHQNLMKSLDDNPLKQVRRELEALQQQLADALKETRQAHKNTEALRTILEQQQAQHARAIQAMEQQLADQRRLIARQHFELVDLMGEAYAQSIPAKTD